MYRINYSFLQDWKQRSTRKPLIIRGSRQVGKTYLVEQFSAEFDGFISINFEEKPEYCKLFSTNDVNNIVSNISLEFNRKIVPGKTLIFLDEIQMCPAAIPTLRYFYEQMPGLHIIAAGSLLDHVLNKLKLPMPVGRVEFLYMYPMNFHEFLLATGEEMLAEFLGSFKLGTEISEVVHDKLIQLLRKYFFVGGMPEAVKVYVESADLIEVERVHESILSSMEIDFSKYGTNGNFEVLRRVLRYLPVGIGKKLKYAEIDPALKSTVLKQIIEKLELSRIMHRVSATTTNKAPLLQGIKPNIFKPVFFDIGLATHLLKIRLTDLENIMTANEGELAEQFIGQQLLTREPHFIDGELFYWVRESRDSNAEIDYLLEVGNNAYPVEVKAGKTGTLKSLHVFVLEKKIQFAFRFNTDMPNITRVNTTVKMKTGNQDVEYQLISLPLYMVNYLNQINKVLFD